MFQVTQRVKAVSVLLMALSLTVAVVLFATQPIELGKEDRFATLPLSQVMSLTRNRVKVARDYTFFVLMVPSALQRYPGKAFKQMEADLKVAQSGKSPALRQKADYALRLRSKLVFETVDGQLRKARNASQMIAFGLCLLAVGCIFVLLGWIRTMFCFLLVGLFCVGMPVKDQWLTLALTFFAPIGSGLLIYWLIRDNPPRSTPDHPNAEADML